MADAVSNLEAEELRVGVDGVCVHVSRAGSGPALLLVHGLVGSLRNWEQNIDAFAALRTVYALDLPNMGESERVAGLDAGLAASADRLARTMEELGIESAEVAGHSHGGAIALMLASRHPGKVRGLILFAPANPYCQRARNLIRFYGSRFGTWFARRIPAMPTFVKRVAHRRMFGDPGRASEGSLQGYIVGLGADSVEHVLSILQRWWSDMEELRDALGQVPSIPTLLVWGDRDPAVGVESGQRLAQELDARLIVLPGVGHLSFEERPQDVNRLVSEWLSG